MIDDGRTQGTAGTLRHCVRVRRSSIGRKSMMAISGLLLIGFLLTHVGGNLTLLADKDGATYNAYAAKLRSFGPLLWVARAGLAALFVVHIYLAFRVSATHRRARGARYAGRGRAAVRARPSSAMLLTGIVLLVFLVVHLWHFSFDSAFVADGAGLVRSTLAKPVTAVFYALGLIALWLHLWHAAPSALQTLGISHPRWSRALRLGGLWLAGGIATLFLVILSAILFDSVP